MFRFNTKMHFVHFLKRGRTLFARFPAHIRKKSIHINAFCRFALNGKVKFLIHFRSSVTDDHLNRLRTGGLQF